MISPEYLLSQNVNVFRTLQQPGEFVVTLPGSYHSGFSTGLNIGEAVNFAHGDWIKYGLKCRQIYGKTRYRIPVFPIEWLVVKNIQHLGTINIDNAAQI